MEDESYLVVIEGGSPWGFGIQGGLDFRSPLRVKMVTPGGRASKSGLVTGDYITAINGQETKPLKHMQAQQLIKKSTQKVELTCVKLRSSLISPATTSSFSFPSRVANGSVPKSPVSRSPVISSKPVARPAPPPVVVNGHNRQSSLGTPSESTASSSPHSCAGGESYEAKFIGMDTYCIDKSHPMPDVEVQESVDVVQVKEEPLVTYDLGGGEYPQEVVEEVAEMVEARDELQAYNLESMEEPSETDQQEEAPVEQVEQTEEAVNDEPTVSETVEAIVMAPKDVDITYVHDEESPIVEEVEAVVMQNTAIELNCDTAVESEVKQPSPKASPSVNKMDLVNIIAHAAERKRRESRESSMDSEDPTKDHSSPEKSPQIIKKQSPKHSPRETTPKSPGGKSVMSASKPPKPVRAVSIEAKEDILPVAQQPLKQTGNPVAVGSKEPGWYKQMFQDFQHTVEDCFPGSSSGSEGAEYVYDERGLKVRRDSLPRNTEPPQPEREAAPSPDDPVYVYDERGLRVRADSLSKVQSSTSPEAEKMRTEQRPKSANTPKLSVDAEVTTDDVLSASRRQTSLKAKQYNTDGSRDYWKQKNEDQKEFEETRRKSQEQLHVRQSSSSSDYSSKMTSLHPLLAGAQENKEKPAAADGEESERVFNRIDASKLQGALENASMLNQLEKEGVAPELLPGVAKGVQEEKNKPREKQLKPPPGRKGKALFTFDGQTAKELSFKKGDIIDLLHTVDANWLQGSLGGAKGIFPVSYIQVLSLEEYRQLISPEPKARTEVGRAKALFDFQGQTSRELSFSKDDELIIKKKIDDNWYEGFHGDKEGIFPVAYVKEL